MDGAGPDYDKETVEGVAVLDYGGSRVTGGEDGGFGGWGLGYFVLEKVGCCEWVVAADWKMSVLCWGGWRVVGVGRLLTSPVF